MLGNLLVKDLVRWIDECTIIYVCDRSGIVIGTTENIPLDCDLYDCKVVNITTYNYGIEIDADADADEYPPYYSGLV